MAYGQSSERSQDLIEKYRDISFLCQHYDPYSNKLKDNKTDIDEKVDHLLKKYQLKEKTHDPFQITNSLLVMLDELQTTLKQ